MSNPDTLRQQAEQARKNAERAYQSSEYPRVGRAAYNGLAEALENQATMIESLPDPDEKENDFEAKRQARINRLKAKASRLRVESAENHARSHDVGSRIPFGQPILVGHHSEHGHRKAVDRIWDLDRKAYEQQKHAAELERKARAAERNNAIYTEDPDALDKLREKLEGLKYAQERMKLVNSAYRARKKDPNSPKSRNLFEQLTEKERFTVQSFKPPYSWINAPFASYSLSNNNANIKRVEARIKELENRSAAETAETVIGDVQIIENIEANRVQILFPDKPEANVRKDLKSNGFRWAPSEGAWQRHLNPHAVYLAKTIVERHYA